MQVELFTGSTCNRNFSQDQHARGTFHRINMHQELLTGSTCTRNFSQDQHARGTPFTGSTCTKNFSQDQHGRGTFHWINMHQRNFSQDQHARGTPLRVSTCKRNFLQRSTCKRTFWSAFGCFSLDVKLYRLLSISPILLLSIFPFFHYCQLFSYYSILFSSVVNCLEPWIYAWLSLFRTTHDLRFKDLGRCLWLKWGDSKQHIHVPEISVYNPRHDKNISSCD